MDRSNGRAVEGAKDVQDGDSSGGADFLQLDIRDAPLGGRADWLAEQLRCAIADGRLPLGSVFPATRVLSAELRVSRGVVTEAYQRLSEDGHVEGRGRNGTVVVAVPVPVADPAALTRASGVAEPAAVTGASGVAGRRVRAVPVGLDAGVSRLRPTRPRQLADFAGLFGLPPGEDVFDLIRSAPARIDLSPGVPDLAAFPRAAWLRAEREVLGELAAGGFGYGDPRGTVELRQAVAHWLGRNRGIRVEPDEVLIVAGTAQALALIGGVLREDGV